MVEDPVKSQAAAHRLGRRDAEPPVRLPERLPVLPPARASAAADEPLERAYGDHRARARALRPAGLPQLLGDSAAMLRLKTRALMLLDDEALSGWVRPVLLQGQLGTGKRSLARALHDAGARRDRPFVTVEAADLVDTTAPVQPVGVARWAPSNPPDKRLADLMLLAAGGSLYLSDMAALTLPQQGTLLDLIEAGWEAGAGSNGHPLVMDVRVLLATRQPLDVLLRNGRVLPALYTRLSQTSLRLPPLQERVDDLPGLARLFIDQAARHQGLTPPRLSDEALALLVGHPWTAHLHELRQALDHAVLQQTQGLIEPEHLPAPFLRGAVDAVEPLRDGPISQQDLNLQRIEREALQQALQQAFGNVSKAARLLGISRDTLRFRIHRHGLQVRR